MQKNLFLLCLSVSIILLAGCESLPSGEAPSGTIVITGLHREKYSWPGAKNYMLTSLSMFCLQNFPQGSSFSIDFQSTNKNLKIRSWEVLRSLRDSVPVRLLNQSTATYRLSSGISKNNIWSMRLTELKTKKVVWLERVNVKGE